MPPRPSPVRRHSRDRPVKERLHWLLREHQALHDPAIEPRNRLPWLPELRRWQSRRLEASFDRFLRDPQRRPAAQFFLSDVYNEHDFAQRDADIARVLPMMQRLLPEHLLATVADAIELGLLTHALDLRMAQVLEDIGGSRRRLDAARYARAYRLAIRSAGRWTERRGERQVKRSSSTRRISASIGPFIVLSRKPSLAVT